MPVFSQSKGAVHQLPACALTLSAILWATVAQAQLDPPGAPADTMKTLDQIEPRTPISSLPFSITQPGTYYVTSNLSSQGTGIYISADNVNVDLMGHTITFVGDVVNAPGITLEGAVDDLIDNVTVRNGSVRGFQYGVRIDYARDCRIEGLHVADSTTSGVYFFNGAGLSERNTVKDCHIVRSGLYGIRVSVGEVGEWSRNTISGCVVEQSGFSGTEIFLNEGTANENTITDSIFRDNSNWGILFNGNEGASIIGNSVLNSTITGNTGVGVQVISAGPGGDASETTIRDCKVTRNGGDGIFVAASLGATSIGNVIHGCQVSGTGNYGIWTLGVSRTLIEKNHVTSLGGGAVEGIRSAGAGGNFIFSNVVSNYGQNYFLNNQDTYGPIVSATGALLSPGHPQTNFSR